MPKITERLHHENWPTPVFYFPIFLYYLYNSVKFRRLNYFTAVNPALKSGGLCGFSKYESLIPLNQNFFPKTILLKKGEKVRSKDLVSKLKESDMSFPVIIKPDQGERGFLVKKAETLHQAMETLTFFGDEVDFIIQDYVEGPLELGVFLMKKDNTWEVSSVTSKEFLKIVGDGERSVKELIEENKKALKYTNVDYGKVLEKGEILILEPIGNHCRGTGFVNSCDKINSDMVKTMTKALETLEGINYCRLDLRTPSWDALDAGDFKIMEINGVSAEPGHIYDPNVKLGEAYKDLFFHWKSMAEIAEEQVSSGVVTEDLKDTLKMVSDHLNKKRKVNKSKEVEVIPTFKKIQNLLEESSSLHKLDPEKFLDEVTNLTDIHDEKLFERSVRYDHYDRVSLFFNEGCEVVLCRWQKGDISEVHHHPGKSCWFKCIKGEITEARQKEVSEEVIGKGQNGYIDDSFGSHQMKNMSEEDSFSLHFYRNI